MKPHSYLLFLLLPLQVISQSHIEPVSIIKENAIPIEDLLSLSSDIYSEIDKYDVIMVGEMHGTNEPTEFVSGLCELITKNEEKVVLAIEISSRLMDEIPFNVSEAQLKAMEFFSMENTHGTNGKAWLQLIQKCSQNKKISLKFIDNFRAGSRDSSMYLEVLEIKQKYPNTKIVTLTGNIHNWLKPFRGKVKLGGYFMNDMVNFNPEKIMSINHIYKEGTMMNNTGNGLELQIVKGKDTFFNMTIGTKMYLCPRVFEKQNQYTHFLYTEQVSHSETLDVDGNK